MHTYMNMSQGNSLCYLKQTKMSFFFLSFTKSENGRVEKVLPGAGVGYSGKGEEIGKGCGRVNMVQMLCTHVC
jgi:hypothetical protein